MLRTYHGICIHKEFITYHPNGLGVHAKMCLDRLQIQRGRIVVDDELKNAGRGTKRELAKTIRVDCSDCSLVIEQPFSRFFTGTLKSSDHLGGYAEEPVIWHSSLNCETVKMWRKKPKCQILRNAFYPAECAVVMISERCA